MTLAEDLIIEAEKETGFSRVLSRRVSEPDREWRQLAGTAS